MFTSWYRLNLANNKMPHIKDMQAARRNVMAKQAPPTASRFEIGMVVHYVGAPIRERHEAETAFPSGLRCP